MYPGQKIGIVAPVKEQSGLFIKKAKEWVGDHPALAAEILKFSVSKEGPSIEFKNGSIIYSLSYGENALGHRLNILIVDEFVRTDKSVITRVYIPMLSDERRPEYRDLSFHERQSYYDSHREFNRQLFLSSVRSAEEWSYQRFEEYIDSIANGDERYMAISLPYHFGVMNGYISDNNIEQSFKENQDTVDMLVAEYLAIPERNSGDSFYKYRMFSNVMDNSRALYAMSDEEYITYRDNLSEWPYYTEKLPGEIRVLSMDVALIESAKNDNSMLWIIRLIPDNGKFIKILAYGESIHGINSLIQAKRAKQLFYEMQCDWFVLDTQGVGIGVFDICTTETYDESRGIVYPAWGLVNEDEVNIANHVISNDAIPVIYSIKTPIQIKSEMFVYSRNVLTNKNISLLVDTDKAIEYLNDNFSYSKLDDSNLKSRLMNPYVQTHMLWNEAINMDQVITQGYINLKEKSGRRKDRVMAFIYGLYYCKILEDRLSLDNDMEKILEYIAFA